MSQSHTPRIWIMAGGTGGHIVPGLAVAQILKEEGSQVSWLGNPQRMEGQLVAPTGIPMIAVQFAAVRGKGLWRKLVTPFALAAWTLRVWIRMLRQRPDVVLGMGGYVSVPGGLAAWLARVPIVLHEQNAVAGMSNRLLARLAATVLSGFPDTLKNATWVGNPVRQSMLELPAPARRYGQRTGPLRVLVVGGSLGAAALNTVVPQAIAQLNPENRPIVTHQSGASHLDVLKANYEAVGVQAECVAFIDDMAQAMGEADLMICRAGAMTVAEVAAAGVAALFVPFPFAVDDHQTANAQHLVDHEGALLRDQKQLTPEWLAQWLSEQTRDNLTNMAQQAQQLAKPEAGKEIAQQCLKLWRRKQ
ncbi:undecaprenyldiphospho-muramoylpentapeptide beta-N-acetylglucosaminyltransferase [Orrella sp. 11846]|uniref:undecaprenyldiphospho-muramoylpentapeptide beta-N-acetylglucosaminyltransferase n=1 Tax=Orrella sp. 11846 TaxID=3409913 RepID=UPI003B5C85D8